MLDQIVSRKHLPALSGLRAVFVAMVVLYHAGLPLPASLGVTGFFVLSGFLITWLLINEYDRDGDISFRGFYWRRSLRIFPAYYAFLALSIGADLALGNHEIKPAIVPSLTYTVNYFNALNGHPPLSIAHAWSLAIEEQFYLIWPLAFLLFVRRCRAKLPWVLGSVILAVMIWRSFAWHWLGSSYAYNAFDTRFDSLAIGCLFAIMLPRLKHMKGNAWFACVLIPIIWAGNLDQIRYTIGFTLSSAAIGLFMLQAMLLSDHPLWRWLEWRPIAYIGSISYGIYLYHILAFSAVHKFGLPVVMGVPVTVAIAACSYHWYEAKLMQLKPLRQRASLSPA